MIEIEDLTKVYPNGHQALDSLQLHITEGVFGLLGANGAGKTTLMRIIATLLRPTAGRVVIAGHDLATAEGRDWTRSILGYLPQETGLHLDLTVEQELDYIGVLKRVAGLERAGQITTVLNQVGLQNTRRQVVRTLSGGMKRRLGIACALIGSPRLLIVDEPTAGLDPSERVRFRNLLYELANERTIILSTHIVEDVAQICPQLAVLHEGHLLFHGSLGGLLETVDGKVWLTSGAASEQTTIATKVTDTGIETRVFSDTPPDVAAQQVSPNLEDAYLWLTAQERAG